MNEAVSHGGIVLAYIGDAVLEILIREKLVSCGMTDTGAMSTIAQKLICAPAQSERMEKLLPVLTEEENAVYRLGRNHHTNSKPKKSDSRRISPRHGHGGGIRVPACLGKSGAHTRAF